jgi:branched-chain amino acid transport system permease protein
MMNFNVVTNQFWALLVSGIALGFIYVLISLGYTMVYGVLRLINFANSEIFMVGTFATVLVSRDLYKFDQNTNPLTGTKLVLTLASFLIASMLASGLTAVFVEFIAYRRLRAKGTNRLASLISAIGTSIVLQEAVRILTHSIPMSNPRVIRKYDALTFGSTGIRNDIIIVIVFAAILYVAINGFVSKTLLGKAIRAVSMSEETSRLMGINLNRVISATFFIGGITTGAAAFLYETVYENTKYNVGFNIGLAAFTAAVLGGIGNIRGAFFGGITLGLLEVFVAAVLGTQWKSVTVFVVLVLVLLFRPNGLFGEAITQSRV